MSHQERAQAKHEQVAGPRQQHVSKQGKDQAQADPASILAGRCVVQPAQQGQHRQRLDQQAQQLGVNTHPVEKGRCAHQRQNQPAHGQFTVIVQSKVCAGSASGSHGCW
ncbi:hypothetical protein D3C76_1341330 [compost metagenome]